ncbi:MAG: hypothetical protein GX652_11290 [Burkholderiaceae bacterium]|nr:hypothetical protein [Burkholderiaceae bacterium]
MKLYASVAFATGALALVASSLALAQGNPTSRMICNSLGGNALEPLPDGRALQVISLSCRVEMGPMAQGVMTGSQIYEFQGPNGSHLAGEGVVRSPAGVLVYRTDEGTTTLKMADGKVVGAASSGRGVYRSAYGSVAGFAGKSYSYKTMATGLNQFVIEVTDD